MEKIRIELERNKNHILHYGLMSPVSAESEDVLDKLVEWSKLNPDSKIYRHKIKYVYENIREPESMFDGRNNSMMGQYCDYVCYLEIYYQ